MRRTAQLTLVSLAILSLVACSSDPETTVPTVTGVDASVAVTVDCAEDGVANVNSQYGTGDASDVLIGRGDTTQDAGGSPTYSRQFGTMAGMGAATLAITTSPTRGTCETKIVDYNGGAVLAESKTAGEVTLTVIVDSGD